MRSSTQRKIRDDHIWWSIFSRPLRSRYSRKQRVSVCMAMVMLTVMTNAMFYGASAPRITDGFAAIGHILFDFYDVSFERNC